MWNYLGEVDKAWGKIGYIEGIAFVLAFAIIGALSRVYLGVHYPTDCLAGFFLVFLDINKREFSYSSLQLPSTRSLLYGDASLASTINAMLQENMC